MIISDSSLLFGPPCMSAIKLVSSFLHGDFSPSMSI